MKKIILTCVAVAFGLSPISASGSYRSQQVTVGVTAGANMTAYTGDADAKWGLGGQIGLNCEVPIGKNFSIMPELFFSYKTIKVNDFSLGGENATPVDATDRLYHMNVPVSVKYGLPLGAGRLFISAGPMLSVGLYGDTKAGDFKQLLFQPDPKDKQQYSVYNNIDVSALFKLGYDFDFGLSVSGGFQMGFLNMYKKDYFKKDLELPDAPSQKMQTISLSLGYNF